MENKTDLPVKISNVCPFFGSLLVTDGHFVVFYSGSNNTITLLHLDTFHINLLSGVKVGPRFIERIGDAAIASDTLIIGSCPWSNIKPSITYYKINIALQTITKEENGPIIPECYSSWYISALKLENDYLMVSMNYIKMDTKPFDAVILLWKKQKLHSEPWKVLKSKAESLSGTPKLYKDMYSDTGSIIALEQSGKIFCWKEVETLDDSEQEEVVDISIQYPREYLANLGSLTVCRKRQYADTLRMCAGQIVIWDFFWSNNILIMTDPKTPLQRDPSSTEEYIDPDYMVRIDPACQFKAIIIITNGSTKIRLRRMLEKHDVLSPTNDIDIPVFDTIKAGLGIFKDAFLHRQLTGSDIGALYIIYIASDGFYKQKILASSLQPADIAYPVTRYIAYYWGPYQDKCKTESFSTDKYTNSRAMEKAKSG
ncbi:hypothetical protein ACMFMG_011806 [Clarireedia jacksonii]